MKMGAKNKKLFLLPLLLTPLLFGCGEEEDIEITWWVKFLAPSNVKDESTRNDPNYASWWAIQDIIKGFEALHPNIHVKEIAYANDPAIASAVDSAMLHRDLLPNMASTYGTYAFNWKDALIDVTEKGKALEEDSDFIQSILSAEAQQYGGNKYYSLPFSKSGEALVYKVNDWNEAKKVPQSFAELMEEAKAIKAAHPEIYGDDVQRNPAGKLLACPIIYKDPANLFFTACESIGAKVVASKDEKEEALLFNNSLAKDIVKQLKKWSNEGLLTTKKHTAKDLVEIFNEGKAEYVITSTANVQDMLSEETLVRFQKVPAWNAKSQRRVISQGPSICFFDKDDREDQAALLFYDHLISGENTALFSKHTGYLPLRAGAYTMPEIAKEVYASKFKGASKDSTLAEKDLAYMGDVLLLNDEYAKGNNYFMSEVCSWSGALRSQIESIIVNVFNDHSAVSEEEINALVESEFLRARYSI